MVFEVIGLYMQTNIQKLSNSIVNNHIQLRRESYKYLRIVSILLLRKKTIHLDRNPFLFCWSTVTD